MTNTAVLERPGKLVNFAPSLALDRAPVAREVVAFRDSAAYAFMVGVLARAALVFVPSSTMVGSVPDVGCLNPAAVQVGQTLLQTSDMVCVLRDMGLPMAALADILDVERKTVYLWADGAIARSENHDRLVQVHALLSHEATRSLRFFHRFWDRKLPDGGTLRGILTEGHLDADRTRVALDFLRPHVTGAMARDAERREDLAKRPKPPASSMTLHLQAGV